MSKFESIPLSRKFPGEPATLPSEDGLNLFISDPRVLDLPLEGEITFRYRRGPATVTEAVKGKEARASADFTLLEIVECEECEVESEASETEESSARIDRLLKESVEEKE